MSKTVVDKFISALKQKFLIKGSVPKGKLR